MCPVSATDLPALTRPHFFAGQLLSADDLRAEQEYQRTRAQLHNRLLHGWGVVTGFEARSRAGEIVVSPGLALDAYGNELILAHDAALTVAPGSSGCAARFVVARLSETFIDPVVVGSRTEFTRVVCGVTLETADVAPRGHDGAVTIARLLWRTTQWRVDARYRRRRAK